jgi:hypothetical protein
MIIIKLGDIKSNFEMLKIQINLLVLKASDIALIMILASITQKDSANKYNIWLIDPKNWWITN